MTVCTTLIVDYFHEEQRRNKYLGLQTVATTLAATVFIILGGALGVGGWHTPFWVYAISLVIAVPMIFVAVGAEPRPTRPTPTPTRREGAGSRGGGSRLPLVVTLFGGFTFYVMLIETSYLARRQRRRRDRHRHHRRRRCRSRRSSTAAGALTFPRSRSAGRGSCCRSRSACRRSACSSIWVVGGVAGVVIGAVIAGFGSGLLLPSLVTWALATIRFEERGRSTGWWKAAFFFGQFLTPILMGAIVAAVGGLPSPSASSASPAPSWRSPSGWSAHAAGSARRDAPASVPAECQIRTGSCRSRSVHPGPFETAARLGEQLAHPLVLGVAPVHRMPPQGVRDRRRLEWRREHSDARVLQRELGQVRLDQAQPLACLR